VHVERELKFAIDTRAAARATRVIPFASRARVSRLESVYYDTPDFRLRRANAALRLRRDGRRWLQALKVQQGPAGALAERAEWEMTAPHGKLDCALFPREAVRTASGLDVVRLARLLRPVFTTRFERTIAPLALPDGVRAIACLDRGTIEAGRRRAPILELELELQEGAIGPLIEMAETLIQPLGLRIETASKAERGYRLAANAGPLGPARWSRPRIPDNAAASHALAAIVSAALAQVAANAAGLLGSRDPEYLHQLRVGVRRLRSALRAFRPLLRRKRARAVEEPLKRMMQTFGEARDWDVFCETLADAGSPSGLLGRAQRRRAAARAEARRLAASPEFQRLQLQVLRWLHADPCKRDQSLQGFARDALSSLHRATLKRARKIDWHDAKRRHEVRIRVKRLRYACDFFAPCFPRQAVWPFSARLTYLQDTLGELNDIAVARKLLLQLDETGWRGALNARERQLIGSLEPAWKAFAAQRPFWRLQPERPAKR